MTSAQAQPIVAQAQQIQEDEVNDTSDVTFADDIFVSTQPEAAKESVSMTSVVTQTRTSSVSTTASTSATQRATSAYAAKTTTRSTTKSEASGKKKITKSSEELGELRKGAGADVTPFVLSPLLCVLSTQLFINIRQL